MASQSERRERTRSAIVAAATDLFVRNGYTQTRITDVLEAAEISRGALYHHFASKEEVFEAVYESVSADAVERAGRAAKRADAPLDIVIAGCLAWINISAEPTVAQILFVEGPKAIGWDRCRDLEEHSSLGRVRAGLTAAARAGEIGSKDLELTARLLNAAVAEAALAIHMRRPHATRAGAHRTVSAIVNGLRP